MISLPRLALATPSDGPEPACASLALLAGFSQKRWRVQHFRSRACPMGTGAVGQITGLPGRHLDAWLMPPPVARAVFSLGAARADLAVVEGTLEPGSPICERPNYDCPGDLGPIVQALELPTIALVSCPAAARMHLPRLPQQVDAVVLDGLEDASQYDALKRTVSLMLNRPVVGAVEALPQVRSAIHDAARDEPLDPALFDRLGASFLKFADLGAIRSLAESRPFPEPADTPQWRPRGRFRVAYAQDEAFGAYFPDTLETLEALGAELVDFSPLRDERLPDAVDLVMIGCGYPDKHAFALAQNHCLIAALRAHVCAGQRIYSEGGGTAYLGRSMILEGVKIPGAEILPFDAVLRTNPEPPQPVSRVLSRDGWLGPRGTLVRGYCSGRWQLQPISEPLGYCPSRSGPLTAEHDMFFRHHAVGGLLHLHLVSLPQVVAAFACPHQPSLSLP